MELSISRWKRLKIEDSDKIKAGRHELHTGTSQSLINFVGNIHRHIQLLISMRLENTHFQKCLNSWWVVKPQSLSEKAFPLHRLNFSQHGPTNGFLGPSVPWTNIWEMEKKAMNCVLASEPDKQTDRLSVSLSDRQADSNSDTLTSLSDRKMLASVVPSATCEARCVILRDVSGSGGIGQKYIYHLAKVRITPKP